MQPHWTTEPRPFMPTKKCKYTVLVFLKNGGMHTKIIEAYSSESATTQARELFDIDSILFNFILYSIIILQRV